jgi:hypothetical protein
MGDTAMVALPVAFIEALAIVARPHPSGSLIRGTGPISVVPPIMSSDRVPIPSDPDEIRTRLGGQDRYDSRWGWNADLDANRDIRRHCGAGQNNQSKQCPFHKGQKSTLSAKPCEWALLLRQRGYRSHIVRNKEKSTHRRKKT